MEPQQQPPKEMDLDQAVGTLLAALPAPVRDFVTGPKRDQVALDITNKYRLHADQAGQFQRSYVFMLLGITTPEQFTADLQSVGVDAATVANIANDVNERVFIPIRKEEQRASAPPAPAPTKPAPLAPPAITMRAPTPAPQTQTAPPSPQPPPRPAPAPQPVAHQPTPRPVVPTPSNLPGAPVTPPMPAPVPPRPQPSAAPTPAPVPAPAKPNAAREELHAVLKSYGIDPYREMPE